MFSDLGEHLLSFFCVCFLFSACFLIPQLPSDTIRIKIPNLKKPYNMHPSKQVLNWIEGTQVIMKNRMN